MRVLSYPVSIMVQCLEDAGEHASLPSPVMMPCIDRRWVRDDNAQVYLCRCVSLI